MPAARSAHLAIPMTPPDDSDAYGARQLTNTERAVLLRGDRFK